MPQPNRCEICGEPTEHPVDMCSACLVDYERRAHDVGDVTEALVQDECSDQITEPREHVARPLSFALQQAYDALIREWRGLRAIRRRIDSKYLNTEALGTRLRRLVVLGLAERRYIIEPRNGWSSRCVEYRKLTTGSRP